MVLVLQLVDCVLRVITGRLDKPGAMYEYEVMDSFAHKKSLGQHFLNSAAVPRWMCDAANVDAADTVLEIGPGTGALTSELLARGATVCAIETDERAITALRERFAAEVASGQLTVTAGDMRTLSAADIAQLCALAEHSYKIVSNIPYYLSGALFRTFLDSAIQPSTLVFLIQKEVATRIARDRKSSLLSLSVRAFGDPTYVRTVKRGHFTPPPQVDSAILLVENISRVNFTTRDHAQFFTLLHLGFGQKRKQLLGNLAVTYDRTHITQALAACGLAPTVRAEDLSLPKWLQLDEALQSQPRTQTN